MTIDKVRVFLSERGFGDRLHETPVSSATVELAAAALGVEPARIAKTLSFLVKDKVVLIVAAGNARIDNRKFKDFFGTKAKMLPAEDTERLTGNAAGGVCPFLAPEGVEVWLDETLHAWDVVYPSGGNDASGVELTPAELEQLCSPMGWLDVCKLPEPAAE